MYDNQRPIVIRQETKMGPFQFCCGFGCLTLLILALMGACTTALGL